MINLPGLTHGNDYPDCPCLAGHAIHYHADIGLILRRHPHQCRLPRCRSRLGSALARPATRSRRAQGNPDCLVMGHRDQLRPGQRPHLRHSGHTRRPACHRPGQRRRPRSPAPLEAIRHQHPDLDQRTIAPLATPATCHRTHTRPAESHRLMAVIAMPRWRAVVCWGEVGAQDHTWREARHQAAARPDPRPPVALRHPLKGRACGADRGIRPRHPQHRLAGSAWCRSVARRCHAGCWSGSGVCS